MEEQSKPHFPILFVLSVFVLLIVLSYGIFLLLTKSPPTKPKPIPEKKGTVVEKVVPSPTLIPGGSFFIKSMQEGMSAAGETVSFTITGDSINRPVTGFDIVVQYNPSFLSYLDTRELLQSSYRYIIKKDPGSIIISGIPDEQDRGLMTFKNTDIAHLNFTMLQNGQTQVRIYYVPSSKTDSNLICEGDDILRYVNAFDVVSVQRVELMRGVSVEIQGTPFKLSLLETTIPPASCSDCFTRVEIDVYNKEIGTSSAIAFSSGGFAGQINDQLIQYGFIFKLEEAKENNATISIMKE